MKPISFTFTLHDANSAELIQACERSLTRFGEVHLTHVAPPSLNAPDKTRQFDAMLSITLPSAIQRYVCEIKSHFRPEQLPLLIDQLLQATATTDSKPLLIAPYISNELGERLRQAGVAYLDAAGNALLFEPPLFVWLRGFKPEHPPARVRRTLQTAGIQLITFLLHQPEAIDLPYRELASTAGISLGSTARTLSELRGAGFIRTVGPDRNELTQRDRLFEQWELGYTARLRPKLQPRRYRQANPSPLSELPSSIPPDLYDSIQIGGELAAALLTDYLRPQTATLHVRDIKVSALLRALRLVPDPQGNITLLHQFGEQHLWRQLVIPSTIIPLAPPVLTHAELFQEDPDSRLRETAQILFDRLIKPTL